jgi:ABC-type nitrate/sulfonate/bicarbonate transport system permease component
MNLPDVRDWPAAAGTPAQVRATLRAWQASGQLIDHTAEQPVPGAPGRVMVRYWLAKRPTPRTAGRSGAAVAAGLAVGLVAGVAVGLAVGWVLHHLVVLAGVAAVVLLVAWWLAGQSGSCPGLHCPGCKCR